MLENSSTQIGITYYPGADSSVGTRILNEIFNLVEAFQED